MHPTFFSPILTSLAVSLVLLTGAVPRALASLADGLVSHWPLDEVQGTKTPDTVSGYDFDLNNLTAADLVPGKVGKAFSFSNTKKTMLSRVHKAGEALPINQYPSFTISFWEKVNGTGQNDLRLFSEANTGNSDPLFNLGTHNVDGTLDVFIRQSGWTTVNHITTTGQPFDDQWHHIAFVQDNGARAVYLDGTKDDLAIPDKQAGTFNANDTTVGGILRASAGFWVTGLIDDVALWKRALSPQEIADVMANGVPAVSAHKLPLEIRSFTSDFPSVAQGDKVILRWQASQDATLAIDNGVGDLTASTTFGAGNTEVTVKAPTTYALTATRGNESVSAKVTVNTIAGVAPGWRLIENFDAYSAGGIAGKGNWVNPEPGFSVVDLGLNKVFSYTGGNELAALPLNSLALPEGQKASLFFRLYVSPTDTTSVLGINFGLTERPIRFNGDFNGNVGPYLRLERAGDGATVDLLAHNGVGAAYDSAPDAIRPGQVYRVWIDVDNRPFDVQAGVQNGGDHYTVYLQKEGAAARATLFQDYVSDRDAVNIDPTFGAPGTTLTHLFVAAIGGNQGTNNVVFDDFYISTGGFKDTVPVAASTFVKVEVPKEIKVSAPAFDRAGNAFTLGWSSSPGAKYSVQRADSVTGPWTDAANVTATGTTTTYTDQSPPATASFYRIRFVP